MISQERVIEIYNRANPIKDPKSAIAGTDAAGYLATLERRSSEMTQLDARPERTSDRRRGRLLLVSAVAAVLLGVAIVILTQANEEPPVVTNPPATTLVVPTTQAPTNTEVMPTTTLTAEGIWEQTPVGMSLDGGEARTGEFAVPFRFATPPGWIRLDPEFEPILSIGVPGSCPSVGKTVYYQPWRQQCDAVLFVSRDDTIEEVAAEITALTEVDTTEMQEIEIGGAQGLVFQATTVSDTDQATLLPLEPFTEGVQLFADETMTVYLVDVSGATVVVLVSGSPEFTETATGVLGTITWRSLQ